ncbi:MAG: TadE/TadG family type IV pilus assembly protein [Beijerinckiaceae bacterium]|nr:TadE/TadG family type IV pilus assembly protein [Beijerinckiaceae bacterium]
MRHPLRRFPQSRRGTAAIEFALIIPVMLLFMAGTVECGRAFQAYRAVNQLASRYASTWADCSDSPAGTCNTQLATYAATAAIQNLVPQLAPANITLRMLQVSITSGVATTIYATPSGATLTANELAIAQNAIASGQTGVVVTVTYTHNLIFFQSLMNPILGASRTFSFTVAQDKS